MMTDMQNNRELSTVLGNLFQDSVEVLAEEAKKAEKK